MNLNPVHFQWVSLWEEMGCLSVWASSWYSVIRDLISQMKLKWLLQHPLPADSLIVFFNIISFFLLLFAIENIISITMDKLRKTYNEQAQSMSKKSRFGFFSILPSHTAGITDFQVKPCKKDGDGKVVTEERNFYTNPTASGVGKKSYFSQPKSIYQGDPYKDKKSIMSNKDKSLSGEKEVFKPARLNKTLMSASYEYISDKKPSKNPKDYRNADGKVKTEEPNIAISQQSKIDFGTMKKYKYIESPYDNIKQQKKKDLEQEMMKRRGEGPFRAGNPVKQYFRTNVQAFNDHLIKKTHRIMFQNSHTVPHECSFKPSCRKDVGMNGLFSYPKHMPEGKPKTQENGRKHKENVKSANQPLKLSKRPASTKPCPSITYLNCMRKVR